MLFVITYSIVNLDVDNIKTIKIGVIGVGHLGNFHISKLKEIPKISISGIFDIDKKRSNEISDIYKVNCFSSIDEIVNGSDAISIVTPTSTHYDIANMALDAGCHIFVEKPITNNICHANELLIKAANLKKIIQVGHIERFNPAFSVLKNMDLNPTFIESHRLSEFNPRGNDVPVILDLMIHDLDIILSLVNSKIKNIQANGVKVISKSVDIANARIEFENGCVANVTASRISQKNMRKMRIFQNKEYLTIDYKNKSLEQFKIINNVADLDKDAKLYNLDGYKYILHNTPIIEQYDALYKELAHFIDSIRTFSQPQSSGESATKALELSLLIQKIIDE